MLIKISQTTVNEASQSRSKRNFLLNCTSKARTNVPFLSAPNCEFSTTAYDVVDDDEGIAAESMTNPAPAINYFCLVINLLAQEDQELWE